MSHRPLFPSMPGCCRAGRTRRRHCHAVGARLRIVWWSTLLAWPMPAPLLGTAWPSSSAPLVPAASPSPDQACMVCVMRRCAPCAACRSVKNVSRTKPYCKLVPTLRPLHCMLNPHLHGRVPCRSVKNVSRTNRTVMVTIHQVGVLWVHFTACFANAGCSKHMPEPVLL